MNNRVLLGNFSSIFNIMNTFENLCNYISYIVIVDEIIAEDEKFLNYDNYLNKYYTEKDEIIISTYEDYSVFIQKLPKSNKYIYARKWILDLLKENKIMHRPRRIRLDLSTMCQLNCRECYMRTQNNGAVGIGFLKFEQFKTFIENNPYINEIEVSNSGEVFLNPDLEKILKYSYENNITITMCNGVNLNSASDSILEALVKYQVNAITISIDGVTNETYSYYRRNGNLDKVLENIKKINEYKAKYNSMLPTLTWQFILMNNNEDEAEKAAEMASSLNMDVLYKVDWSGKYKPKDPNKITELTGENFDGKWHITYCQQMIFSPQINWDGRLLGCCVVFKSDWKVNVFSNGLEAVLNSPNYRRMIYTLLGDNTSDEVTPCSDCYTYEQCILNGERINI